MSLALPSGKAIRARASSANRRPKIVRMRIAPDPSTGPIQRLMSEMVKGKARLSPSVVASWQDQPRDSRGRFDTK